MSTQTKQSQNEMTPADALKILLEGNERFVNKKHENRDYLSQVLQTSTGQYPFATILSCIDSRIPTEIVFDQGIGDIFNARIAGNFINYDILGSLEFGSKLAGAKLIMVMGHTLCGAVKGACDHADLGNLTQMLDKIQPAVESVETAPGEERNSSNSKFVNEVSKRNVEIAVENIKKRSTVLRNMLANGEIDVVGAMYDIHTGKVTII